MNLLFDIGHPGQVHLFRHVINILKDRGHDITVTTKDIPSIKILLEKHNIPYISLGEKSDSIFKKALNQLRYNYNLQQ